LTSKRSEVRVLSSSPFPTFPIFTSTSLLYDDGMGISETVDPTRAMVEPKKAIFAEQLTQSRSGLAVARDYLLSARGDLFRKLREVGVEPKPVPHIPEVPQPAALPTIETMPKVASDWLHDLPEGVFAPGAITSAVRPPRENLGSKELLAAIDAATGSSDPLSDEMARARVDEQRKELLPRATRQVFFNSMGQQAGYTNTETGAKYNFTSGERLVRDSLSKTDFILQDGREKNIVEWEKDYLPTKHVLPNNW
jgi:hypothetical protein